MTGATIGSISTGTFTEDEIAFMDYMDELVPELPYGSYGLLLRKGDPIAFQLGMNEWIAENEREPA